MKFLTRFEEFPGKPIRTLAGFLLVGLVGVADFLTGYEFSFSLFYLIPISLVAWLTGRWQGIAVSLISALVWLLADVSAGQTYSHPAIYFWNTLIRLVFFVIVTWLLTALRSALEQERELSRVDSLTGAVNPRFFYILVQMELDRSRRYLHPFTLAYIDLDNFKMVNDQLGHSAGDQVLRCVAQNARKHLRKTDIVARLGGDEFALLFPETGEDTAPIIMAKIQQELLQEMRQSQWPVTFSIGVLTFTNCPSSPDEVIKGADDLMYAVKKDGKNAIAYATYPG